MTDERQAFIADLELAVERVQGIMDNLRKECEEHGADFTPEQEGKWTGAFMMARGILADELRPMLKAWKDGHQSSRKGEQIMGREG